MLKFTYRQDRIFGLDILRTIAILFVVYSHGYNCLNADKVSEASYNLPVLLDGVTVFFVLSGFLVGSILINLSENNRLADLKGLFKFWKRRWLRTLPNYYLIFLIITLYEIIFFNTPYSIQHFLKYIFFLQNFYSPPGSFFIESWSLTVEEWFYLLFPITYLIIYFLMQKNKRSASITTIIIFLACPFVLRTIYYLKGMGLNNARNYYREIMVLRLDSIVYGVLGAFISFYYHPLWIKYKRTLLLTGITLLIFLKIFFLVKEPPVFYSAILRHSILPFLVLLCLPFLSDYNPIRKSFLHRPVTHISVISYSMYLLNFTPVFLILMPLLETKLHLIQHDNYVVKYSLFWFLTILCSYILYICFEKPMMDLREK